MTDLSRGSTSTAVGSPEYKLFHFGLSIAIFFGAPQSLFVLKPFKAISWYPLNTVNVSLLNTRAFKLETERNGPPSVLNFSYTTKTGSPGSFIFGVYLLVYEPGINASPPNPIN